MTLLRAIRSLFPKHWFDRDVHVTDSEIRVRDAFSEADIGFDDIREVSYESVDKITYDEVFLIIWSASASRGVAVGELDDAFESLNRALEARLPNFPRQWLAEAQMAPLGTRKIIWAKN